MASRPLATSLGSLRSQICLRSLLSPSIRISSRYYPAQIARTPSGYASTRSLTYSLTRAERSKDTPVDVANNEPAATSEAEATSAQEPTETPWYLEVEPPSHPPVQEPAPLPPIPHDSPTLLEPLLKYVYGEMGLDDLNLLDLRAFDPPPAIGQNLLMLFGTARSERHLHVASGRLVRWLRYNYKLEAEADGLIGPGELRTKLRRMRRKAKLLGSSTTSKPGGDDGITTGWICVNLGTIGAEVNETARFDDSGKLSGFGNSAVETGCTIVVQVMTESRRTELNLEKLWLDSLARNQRQRETFTPAPSKGVPTGRAHPSQSLPGQKRSYSTQPTLRNDASRATHMSSSVLDEVRRRVLSFQLDANESSTAQYPALIQSIFSPHIGEAHAEEQVSLVEDVMRILSERNENLLNNQVLITIIESIAHSGSKSPILARAQRNLEDLMVIKRLPCPDDVQIVQLLRAYAAQGNWERFWDVWRLPPRYRRARDEDLYAELFEIVAATRQPAVCIEALRKCVYDMQVETPPVFPGDRVYDAILQCISLADPTAIETADKVEQGEAQWLSSYYNGPENEWKESRARILFDRHIKREFVKMVHDLRFARQQLNTGPEAPM
ncbi:hypothetical protein jhhlp_003753 [Lomentospora prolificans]|uniref:ATPase synthesis protein 25 n=1 Tax=Lomentospora prolificans TaxID=41688 RepID=A0A2N3N9L3_9PEZI|nr:hypothetical protein jhhlp_003753 [Lomentospora prolificans]